MRAASAATGGTTKHHMWVALNNHAAKPAPVAKDATVIPILRNRRRVTSRFSGARPRSVSAMSIIICVVVPVMTVLGGAADR